MIGIRAIGICDQIKLIKIAESNPLGTNSLLSVTLFYTFSKLWFVHSNKLNKWRNYLSQRLRTSHRAVPWLESKFFMTLSIKSFSLQHSWEVKARSRDSTVGIVSCLRHEELNNHSLILNKYKRFPLLQNIQTESGTQPAPYSMRDTDSVPSEKTAGTWSSIFNRKLSQRQEWM